MKNWMMLCIVGLLACGDKDDTDTAAEADTDTDTDSDTDTDTDADTDTDTDITYACDGTEWEGARSSGDAADYMAQCVVPTMAPIFQAHNGDEFANFGCATCHGEDFAGGTYQMPSVFALDWGYADYWAQNGIYIGDGSGVMENVASEMTGLLGYEPYDAKTGEGFGCYGCHNQ